MSVELIKEAVRAVQVIGNETTQTVVENDIIVPDIKPDISRVLLLDGDIFIKNTDVSQDRVMIYGSIQYKILYLPEDQNHNIKCINTVCDFSYNLDIPGARQGMRCKPKCYIEHIEHSILNGRKINLKAIVCISAKITNEMAVDVATNIGGLDNIQILQNNITLNVFTGSCQSECNIKEMLEIPAGKPAIKELLRNDVKISGKDYKIAENKIIAKGDLNVSTLYIGDDETNSIQYMEHEVPFTQLMDMDGLDEESVCNIDFAVTGMLFEPSEDTDGELRMLGSDIIINLDASAFSKRTIQTIDDAYSPTTRLMLERKPFEVEDVMTESKTQITARDSVVILESEPEISEVFNVTCKPLLTGCMIQDEKVIVEGVIPANVLYITVSGEEPVSCKSLEIPFRHSIDVKGINQNMKSDAVLDIEHCNYSMISANEVDIRITINVDVKISCATSLPVIIKALESPVDESKLASCPSIVIYFTQPNDTLWKIAKKYYTTVDEIKSINCMSEVDFINPSQQILIPKVKQ